MTPKERFQKEIQICERAEHLGITVGKRISYLLDVGYAIDAFHMENNADFISCIAFGRQAEFVEKYFRQGMRMILSGRIQTGSYVNKDGKKVYTTDIVAEEIEFAESKGKSDNPSSNGNMGQAADNNGFASFTDCEDEDGLPFN